MKTLKNKAKKGFTIVELVIVIAVIAILAAVLIPTFTNVVESANESAAMQESRNEWTEYLVEIAADGEYTEETYYVVYNGSKEYVFEVDKGNFNTEPVSSTDTYSQSTYIAIQYTYTSSNSKVTIYAPTSTIDGKAESAAVDAADIAKSVASTNSTYLSSYTSSTSYTVYATVNDGTNTYYFIMVYGTAWTVDSSVTSISVSTTPISNATNLTSGDYTVSFASYEVQ